MWPFPRYSDSREDGQERRGRLQVSANFFWPASKNSIILDNCCTMYSRYENKDKKNRSSSERAAFATTFTFADKMGNFLNEI